MSKITRVDVSRCSLDVHRDLSVSARERKPGPPERIDGVTVGIINISHDAPHGGEVHPDGDEILYVITGRLRVTGESEPSAALELGPGEGCIVRRGEWHRVSVLEPTQMIHITPGPNGDHRPLWQQLSAFDLSQSQYRKSVTSIWNKSATSRLSWRVSIPVSLLAASPPSLPDLQAALKGCKEKAITHGGRHAL